MRPIDALSIAGDKFHTQGTYDGQTITLRLVGEGNMKAIASVEEVLSQLDTEARRLHPKFVVLDFDKLEFMNSACFKKLLSWIGRVQQMDAEQQYRIRFLSNPKMLWQRRSLHALRCFAVDLITLDA